MWYDSTRTERTFAYYKNWTRYKIMAEFKRVSFKDRWQQFHRKMIMDVKY